MQRGDFALSAQQAHAAYLPWVDFQGTYIYNSKKFRWLTTTMLPTKSFNPLQAAMTITLVMNPETGQPLVVNGTPVPSTVALLPKSALTYNIHSVFAGAMTVTQPIYMGGKIKAMNEITRYAEEIARSMRDNKAQEVVYNVDAAYWQVVSLKAKQNLPRAMSTWWSRSSATSTRCSNRELPPSPRCSRWM